MFNWSNPKLRLHITVTDLHEIKFSLFGMGPNAQKEYCQLRYEDS